MVRSNRNHSAPIGSERPATIRIDKFEAAKTEWDKTCKLACCAICEDRISRVRVTSNGSSPIDLEARFAATVPIEAGSHHQRAFGSGVVVQHGSHKDPGVPSSRGQG